MKDKSSMKNNYIYPQVSEYQETTENENADFNGTITERRNPKMTHIDLQLANQRESSDHSEFISKERRSRKERSRETKLTNNRP